MEAVFSIKITVPRGVATNPAKTESPESVHDNLTASEKMLTKFDSGYVD